MTGRTTARGYGTAHKKERFRWIPLVATGMVPCAFCGKHIRPGQSWHLAHANIEGAHAAGLYSGPMQSACNQAEANGQPRPHRPRPQALAIFDPPTSGQPGC
jgi:hypothetical protein